MRWPYRAEVVSHELSVDPNDDPRDKPLVIVELSLHDQSANVGLRTTATVRCRREDAPPVGNTVWVMFHDQRPETPRIGAS